MTYELLRSDGTVLVDLGEGLVDSSSASIKFVGKNVVNYGVIQNENFLFLLENFSHSVPPPVPLSGQLWFDDTLSVLRLKVYDGANWNQLPSVIYGAAASNQTSGDLWFNTTEQKLYIKTGITYTLIGPSTAATTAQRLAAAVNINGVSFDGTTDITITSNTSGTISPGNYITGSAFNGGSSTTWAVDVGTIGAATAYKVVARDSVGDIWFRVGNGVATSARYADLAEKYLSDYAYDVGTVVVIGGVREVTECSQGDRALGVVSENPGYMMNSGLENGIYIALKGRVPVLINGTVCKGDKLVASDNGRAEVGVIDYFAIALEDSQGRNTVEAVVL